MRLDLNVPPADGVSVVLSGKDLEPGGGKTAMSRPRNPAIQSLEDHPIEGTTRLQGQVTHREFLGNLVRYAVTVGGQVVVVDDAHQAGRKTFDAGEIVSLYLRHDQVRVLPG